MAQRRYELKRLPGGGIRVVDTKQQRVEGVWYSDVKQWIAVAEIVEASRSE